MMLQLLVAASLFASVEGIPSQVEGAEAQDTAQSLHSLVVVDVSDLCGAGELRELRRAILDDKLAKSVRTASLDRYSKLLKDNPSERKAEEIRDTIAKFVEPAPTRFFKAELAGEGTIALNCVPAQMDWVERYVEGLRRSPGGLIQVETVFFEVPAGQRRVLLGDRSGQALTSAEAEALEAKINAFEDHERLSAPEVLVHQGARASISIMNETAYISDFVLTVMPDLDQEICDPVIDTVQDGLVMNVRSIPLGPDKIDVLVDFESIKLRRPIKAYKRKVGGIDADFSFQVPETMKVQANARFGLKDDGVIVLGASNPGFDKGEERDTIVFIRAKRVDAEASDLAVPDVDLWKEK